MILLWSESAENQLKDIFDYYSIEAGSRTAKKLINKIIKRVDILLSYPLSGQKEELLLNRQLEYRYLIEGNYKIIYSVQEKYLVISAIFDTRQNPLKMENI